MKSPKSWDEYEIKARYVPCLLSVVPLVNFLVLFLGNTFWSGLIGNIRWMLVANISLSLVVVLALIQFQCGLAKHWLEESVFGERGNNFPSTEMLLYQGGYISNDLKNRIREKLYTLCNFSLPDKESELRDPTEARFAAREAVGQIRRIVGKGVMTHQYNIRYGFIRNLIGGFPWAIIGSIGGAMIYGIDKDWPAMSLFLAVGFFFFSLLVFRKAILRKFAFAYADNLLNEFLTIGEK